MIELDVYSERVMLEATRLDKEFQFVEVDKEYFDYDEEGNELLARGKTYEMRWRPQGSTRWGRTLLNNDDNLPLDYTSAIQTFFQAMKFSERMEFNEI
jgi:hypothetical protein